MRSKDWEYHCALLHKHNSAKFNVPTKRMRDVPVIERFGSNDRFGDLLVLVTCTAALVVVVVLLAVKVL